MTTRLKVVSESGFKIEKGVAFPGRDQRRNYPFAQMEVGDSFRLPASIHQRVCGAASHAATRDGTKFSILKDGDGYRCWRVK